MKCPISKKNAIRNECKVCDYYDDCLEDYIESLLDSAQSSFMEIYTKTLRKIREETKKYES